MKLTLKFSYNHVIGFNANYDNHEHDGKYDDDDDDDDNEDDDEEQESHLQWSDCTVCGLI